MFPLSPLPQMLPSRGVRVWGGAEEESTRERDVERLCHGRKDVHNVTQDRIVSLKKDLVTAVKVLNTRISLRTLLVSRLALSI